MEDRQTAEASTHRDRAKRWHRPEVYLIVLLALLLLLAGASPVAAAVAFDATAADTMASTCPLSWTHTPTGTPRGVVVYVVVIGNAGDVVGAATYGGVAMAEVAGSPVTKATGEVTGVHAFFLGTSLPTGAQTVEVACTAGANKAAASFTVTAGADTEVVDTDATITSDSASNPTATLALGGRTSFASIGFYSGQGDVTSITPLTNWTAASETDAGAATVGFYQYDVIGSTDVSAGWTQAADDAVAIAVALSEVAASGATPRRWMMMGVGR